MSGKSDAIDAGHAARQVLRHRHARPEGRRRNVRAVRLIKIARDSAVRARSTAIITLKATLVTADVEPRAGLESLSDYKLIEATAALEPDAAPAAPDAAMRPPRARSPAGGSLHQEVKDQSRKLKLLTRQVAPQLVETVGIGYDIAAEMLTTAGDNGVAQVLISWSHTGRFRSEAAFAASPARPPSSRPPG